MQEIIKSVLFGMTLSVLLCQVASADSHIGVGVRTGANDDASAVLNGTLKLFDFGDISLSVRPSLYFGSDTEFRLPLTVEVNLSPEFALFGGGGLAVNTDGLSTVDPILSTGLDIGLGQNLVLTPQVNYVFQSEVSDTDTEFVVTFGLKI